SLILLVAVAAVGFGPSVGVDERVVAAAHPRVAAVAQSQWQDVLRNLRNPNAEARLSAVQKLGEAGYEPAAEPISALLIDPDDRVQMAALDAELSFFLTERIGGMRVLGIGSSKSRAQEAFDRGPLVRVATPAPGVLIDRLITAMRDETPRIRFDAVHALGFIAEAPLPAVQARALAEELDHYDPLIRAATARVIGRLRAREGTDKLVIAMGDSSELVRYYAIESLGLVRDDRALPPLRDAVARGKGAASAAALLSLARIGSAYDRSLFRERLTDRNAGVRRAAAEGLGRLRDMESKETLERLLKADPSNDVRLAAAFGLQMLGETQSHVIASMMVLKAQSDQARDYLLGLGRDAAPGIEAVLKVATDAQHRADLLQTLGYVGSAEAVAVIEPFQKDKDERVRRAALNAVARLKRAV
ncbi:MAG: HEAT repeat domain-containing protein, partial [Acidobacteriota bacterium]